MDGAALSPNSSPRRGGEPEAEAEAEAEAALPAATAGGVWFPLCVGEGLGGEGRDGATTTSQTDSV